MNLPNYLDLAQEIRQLVAMDRISEAIGKLTEAIADLPESDELVLLAAQYASLNKRIQRGTVGQELAGIELNRIREALLELVRDLERMANAKPQVFISYSRRGPGLALASELHDTLEKRGFTGFLDVIDIHPGEDWSRIILGAMKASDYFVLLLSEAANQSEMVLKELEEARRLRDKYGKPVILPVRIAWPEDLSLNPKLETWLKRLQHLHWQDESDNPKVIQELMGVISQRETLRLTSEVSEEAAKRFAETAPSPVAPLEIPKGAVELASKYYVEREGEDEFISHITSGRTVLRIRGPRQFGKTSLLSRVIARAREEDYTIVAMDFQDFTDSTMGQLESLIWEVCLLIGEELDLEDELETFWEKQRTRDPKQIARKFIEKIVLKKYDGNLLLAIDEADRVFPYTKISGDFFSMLRAWHERKNAHPIWSRVRLAISYSTEAQLAIQNLNTSPFNIGVEANMQPFTLDQLQDLISKHGLDWSIDQAERLHELIGGHPYLTRKSLYAIAKEQYSLERLMEEGPTDDGPFSDHLRRHLLNVRQFPDLADALADIMDTERCRDPLIANRLRSAGLIVGDVPHLQMANQLYVRYFKRKL